MVYHRASEESSPSSPKDDKEPKNFFRNDGSFLEMFKKMQETSSASTLSSKSLPPSSSSNSSLASTSSTHSSLPSANYSPTHLESISDSKKSDSEKVPADEGKPTLSNKLPIFGKRRGGRALPTGQVKKVKTEPTKCVVEEPKDPWSQYLAEVKKYRESACEDEGKVRPLVK